MRIRHLVTYFGERGEFGGPARVALDLADAQASRGHAVEILAAGERRTSRTTEYGTRIELYPARWPLRSKLGFAAMHSPGMLRQLTRTARSFDIHHLHLGRDMTTLPAALTLKRMRSPYVVQSHGMLDRPNRRFAATLDRLVTNTAVRHAEYVAALTPSEAASLSNMGVAPEKLGTLGNGTRIGPLRTDDRSIVLFLARLHPRKGAVLFTASCVQLAAERPDLEFVVAGPDEGDAIHVNRIINSSSVENVTYVGAVTPEEGATLMSKAVLYVLPAPNEPFGLTIVEALAAGTPVLLHNTAELATHVVRGGVGSTFRDDDLIDSVRQALARFAAVPDIEEKARYFASDNYSVEAIADKVEAIYSSRARRET